MDTGVDQVGLSGLKIVFRPPTHETIIMLRRETNYIFRIHQKPIIKVIKLSIFRASKSGFEISFLGSLSEPRLGTLLLSIFIHSTLTPGTVYVNLCFPEGKPIFLV